MCVYVGMYVKHSGIQRLTLNLVRKTSFRSAWVGLPFLLHSTVSFLRGVEAAQHYVLFKQFNSFVVHNLFLLFFIYIFCLLNRHSVIASNCVSVNKTFICRANHLQAHSRGFILFDFVKSAYENTYTHIYLFVKVYIHMHMQICLY